MTPCQFFYPRMIIEFYHTMTSKLEPHSTTLHFSIDGRLGILRALNIAATFNLSLVLANSTDYRQCPHPLPREMVSLLSGDITAGSALFRRHLPPRMLLIDHILRSNLFPLQTYSSEERSHHRGPISHFRWLLVLSSRANYDFLVPFSVQGPSQESISS